MANTSNGHGHTAASSDDFPTLELEYLAGDIRDRFLNVLRGQAKAWKDLDENGQKHSISEINWLSRSLIRQIVPLIVGRDWDSVSLQIDKLAIDGKTVKLAAILARRPEVVSRLMEYGSQTATLVLCDPEEFYGEREEAEFDPDEPRLPITGVGHSPAGLESESDL